jgi:hypothetical protein
MTKRDVVSYFAVMLCANKEDALAMARAICCLEKQFSDSDTIAEILARPMPEEVKEGINILAARAAMLETPAHIGVP